MNESLCDTVTCIDQYILLYSLKPDMKTLVSSLSKECAVKWYRLGLELEIPDGTLQVIEVDTHNCDHNQTLKKVLREWLRKCTNPTWIAVVQALKTIGLNTTASNIENKYCVYKMIYTSCD